MSVGPDVASARPTGRTRHAHTWLVFIGQLRSATPMPEQITTELKEPVGPLRLDRLVRRHLAPVPGILG